MSEQYGGPPSGEPTWNDPRQHTPYHNQPAAVYGPPPGPVAAPASGLTHLATPIVGALGAVLVMVGSFLPWATVQSVFGTLSVAGTEGDGKITLAAGLALLVGAVVTARAQSRWPRVVQAIAAVGVAVLAGYELSNVSTGVADATNEYAIASTGSGMYVLVVGAVAAAAAAGFNAFRSPDR